MPERPLIVFDSGIGGLSIYRRLRLALPDENIIYIADYRYFPYGNKTSSWLLARFQELGKQFLSLNPKLVVLACNTATVNVVGLLRSLLVCPIVGVEPVIKPLSRFQRPLALMTNASARSKRTKDLLSKYGSHVQIYTPEGLVEAIEYNDLTQVKTNLELIKQLAQKNHLDAIGLSCTHYSLILAEFKKSMPHITFIDPTEAVVKKSLTSVMIKPA